jgi:D-aspartate ligase
MSRPGAVVIGGYANGVSALRSLAREGVRTAVVETRASDIAHHSRYAHEYHRVLDLHRRPDGLIDLLQEQGPRWRGWALIPTNDYALMAISQSRELLSRWYRPLVPDPEIVRQVVLKPNTYRLAAEVGLDLPRCYGPAVRSTAARADIVYPVVVKPVESGPFSEQFERKLLVARDSLELIAAIDEVEQAGIPAQVYDLVPGPDTNFYNYSVYLDRNGAPAAEFMFRKLRQAPSFFGVARAAEPAWVPELREPSLALLRRIGWRGVATVEFKLDPRDGRYRLIEVNGRCYLSHGLATRCGINYPLLSWQDQSSNQRIGASPNGWRGTWLHLHADLLYSAVEERREGRLWSDLSRQYLGPWIDAVWSAADPLPFLAQWRNTARRAAEEVRNGQQLGFRRRLQTMPIAALPHAGSASNR